MEPSSATTVYALDSFLVAVTIVPDTDPADITLQCPHGDDTFVNDVASDDPTAFPVGPDQQGECTLSAVGDGGGSDSIPVFVIGLLELANDTPYQHAIAGVPSPVRILQYSGVSELINVTLSCPAFDNVTQPVLSNTDDVTFTPPSDYYGDCTYSIIYPPEGYYSTVVINVVVQSPLVIISPVAGASILAGQSYPVLVNASNGETGVDATISFICALGDPFTQDVITGSEAVVFVPQNASGICDVVAFSSNTTYANSTTIQVTANTFLSLAPVSSPLTNGQDVSVTVTATNLAVISIPLVLTCLAQSYSQDVTTGSAQPYSIPATLNGVACVFTTPDVPDGYTPITPVTVTVVLGAQGLAAILQQFNSGSFSSGVVQFSGVGPSSGAPLKSGLRRDAYLKRGQHKDALVKHGHHKDMYLKGNRHGGAHLKRGHRGGARQKRRPEFVFPS